MESFLIFPFKVMRKNIGLVLVPALPILFLVAFLIISGANTPDSLLTETDSYLGGTLFLSAADLTAYNDLSTNIQLPLIRLGGIAEKTDIRELIYNTDPANFILIYVVLVLAFMSYSVISRSIYNLINKNNDSGVLGINQATVILSLIAGFLVLFISSFSLAGFKLLLVIAFGTYFTFSIPFAAAGKPLGESIFQGFTFLSKNPGKVIASYLGSMGIAIMAPVALLIFTTPLLVNVGSASVVTILKILLGLFAVIFALFYQMVLCSSAAFATKEQIC
jgi:hypothetical protein